MQGAQHVVKCLPILPVYALWYGVSSRKYPYFPHAPPPSHMEIPIKLRTLLQNCGLTEPTTPQEIPIRSVRVVWMFSLQFWSYRTPTPQGNSSPFCEPGSVDVFLTCTFSMLFSKEFSDLSSVCHSGRLQQHEDQQPSSSESSQSDLYERYLCIYKLWKPVMWQVAQF